MNYGLVFRSLAFVVSLAFFVALCFGLASPVMAASVPSANNLSGFWYFKETIDMSGFNSPEVDFVVNDRDYYKVTVLYSSTNKTLRAFPVGVTSVTEATVLYSQKSGWYNANYRTWNFGNDGQVVPSEFYSWLTSNATYIGSTSVNSVSLSVVTPAPYYPGTDVQLIGQVVGNGIGSGTPESSLYWYVHGNTSEDTYFVSESDSGATLHIGNDETATSLEIEAISTYDTTKSATLELTVTYPLEGVQIIPSGVQEFLQSDKQRTIQYQLLLPNGDPYDYQLIEWYAKSTPGHENYFTIDNAGLLTIAPDAPVGSACTIQFAYQSDTSALSPVGASVQIISQLDGVIDGITPTPEQSDKADQMEDAIGDAAGKLENNNSNLGDLTPTRPQVNTDLQLDQENLLAVSPLVTNIWSINGLGRMISIVLVVATVAYVFFGKRDG